LDTNSIINGLVAIEQKRVSREEEKKSDYELKLTSFNELKSKLEDFYKKAGDLDKITAFDMFQGTSSNSEVASITGKTGGTSGNYDLVVKQLASTMKVASDSFASGTTARGFAGSFSLSVSAAALAADPTVTSVDIAITATDSLKDIANKINRANGAGAKASVVQFGTSDFRLMLTAVDEGSKGFSISPVGGSDVAVGNLGLLSSAGAGDTFRSARSDFNFRLGEGGPATAATAIEGSDLFTGIGSAGYTAGSTITWTATDAEGNNRDGTYTVGAGDTMQDLLDALNTTFDAGGDRVDVRLNDSGEIVITDKTGGNADFSIAFNSSVQGDLGSAVSRSSYKNVISEGKNAFYLMNDLSVSSQTNKDDTTIAGTVFELKRTSDDVVKLQLDYDKAGIKKKVQDFLDGYNQILKYLDEKSKVEIKQNKQDTPFGQVDAKGTKIIKGPFAGDSSILGLKSQLQGMMTSKIDELTSSGLSSYNSLAALGITSEQKTGFLVIKEDKFNEALDADMEGVRRLFNTFGYTDNAAHTFGTYTKDTKTGTYAYDRTGVTFDEDRTSGTTNGTASVTGDGDILNSLSGDSKGLAIKASSGSGNVTFVRGLAGQVRQFYEKITDYVGGFVTDTAKGIQKRIDDQTSRIEKLEKQVDKYKSRLTQQFAQLEITMSRLQSQSASFQSQIGSLRR
jgi:flagellar hook-associated protein 2